MQTTSDKDRSAHLTTQLQEETASRSLLVFSDQVIICKRRGEDQMEYRARGSFSLMDALAISFETHRELTAVPLSLPRVSPRHCMYVCKSVYVYYVIAFCIYYTFIFPIPTPIRTCTHTHTHTHYRLQKWGADLLLSHDEKAIFQCNCDTSEERVKLLRTLEATVSEV